MWLGEHEAAISQLNRALRLSPLDLDLWRLQAAMSGALLFSGKYDEALNWANKAFASRANQASMMFLVACHALVGNIVESKRLLTDLRALVPTMRRANFEHMFTLRRPEDMARWTEAFRLAGLPE